MKKKLTLTICVVVLSAATSQAYKMINIPDRAKKTVITRVSTGDCTAGSSQTDLYINDVRARMLDDGDKWWDLSIAHYIVPQVQPGQTPTCSIFAGAIWVGGVDAGGQLKIAAATYRQNGNDWFPGPIPQVSADTPIVYGNVTAAICTAFDNHWQVFGSEIDSFLNIIVPEHTTGIPPNTTINVPINDIASDILMWPGQGNANNPVVNLAGPGASLAPFEDVGGTGIYDPTKGDYPIIQPSVYKGCKTPVYGDQMIWWVYNDLGNIHTESAGSVPIGMEVKEEAWAYKTNDQINDMTFYHYRIINTATTPLNNTYMAQWVDPDLGWYTDDFAGCDPTRNLGIDYNGEAVDGPGQPNYGDQPPLVGTTFFQGPTYRYRPHPSDTATRDTEAKMSAFISYVNDFSAEGNPFGAQDYYDYLSGFWLDGTPITYGGNGHGGSVKTNYMYPSDPPDNTAGAWSECEANDQPSDVRYIQDAGPFTLAPGAVNDIVVGAVWVRPPVGTYPCPSFISTIDVASDKAQDLFNACFQILTGPDAPDVTITELNQELVINLVNTNSKKVEGYNQTDQTIKAQGIADSMYKFEGYMVYQLLNDQVPSQDYSSYYEAQQNPSEVKQIAECDIKDGIGTIINYIFSSDVNGNIPEIMVQGTDQGIKHTFDVTTDAFAQGASRLINFQPYYFTVISYSYNKYKKADTTVLYDSIGPNNFKKVNIITIDSNLLPFLAGGKTAVYTGIPHMSSPEAGGTQIESYYGEGPFITREEGQGNGGNFLDLTQASVDAIISPDGGSFMANPTYQQGYGPIVVKVIDPKRVPSDSFSLALNEPSGVTPNPNLSNASTWLLTNITTGDTIHSDTTIAVGNEQLIPQWGISIYINQVLGPGYNCAENNGFISSEVVYANNKNQWLSGLVNEAPPSFFHWILSGTYAPKNLSTGVVYPNHSDSGIDDCLNYTNVIGGTWAPYVLCSHAITYSPIWTSDPVSYNPGSPFSLPSKLKNLNSIDVVFTPDETKWSRCVVVEEQRNMAIAQGGAVKMNFRRHANWNGGIDGNGNPVYGDSMGMSYFPGYAINEETGQRLNIFFGEDSWLVSQNGADMLWDPTSNELSATGDTLLGGQHYIYVSSTQYDGCSNIYQDFVAGGTTNERKIYDSVEWVGMTFLAQGSTLLPLSQGLIPNVATVKIRVAKPYATFWELGNNTPVYNFGLRGLAADTNDLAVAENALDSIEVVPNPYYAYSNYEQSQLDNEIKFTNLPQVCTITIYTLDGQLVNTINYTGPFTTSGKFNNLESVNWNLTNTNNVPIASGVYLIYFSSPGLGTRCIKWFGIRRPVDLSAF